MTPRWPERLWIVRHGESAGNVARDLAYQQGLARIDLTGRDVDVPLSGLGQQQARALGHWFAEGREEGRPNVVIASPYLRARAGSNHGYDVVDPTRVDASRGGPEALARFSAAARAAGLGTLIDLVPNHQGVAAPEQNPWWWDVLAHGRKSPFAHYFDIDWDPRNGAGGKLALPVLASEADAAAIAVDRHEHLRLTIALPLFPPRMQDVLDVFGRVAVAVLLLRLLPEAVSYAYEESFVTSPALGLPMSVRAAALPAGIGLMTLLMVLSVIRTRDWRAIAGSVAGGTTRSSQTSRSRCTSGSAFSCTSSEAEVWRQKTVRRPWRSPLSRTKDAASAVISRPRFMGPGCITIACSGMARRRAEVRP